MVGVFIWRKIMASVEYETKTVTKIKEPNLWHVILHNDNVTTMDFVMQVLIEVFDYNEADALLLMLKIHEEGSAIAGTYVHEIAEHKAEYTMDAARQFDFPLSASIEEDA